MGFNITVDRGHAVLLKNLIEYTRKNMPSEFMPEEIVQIEHQINEMLERGCFEHGILCTIFTDVPKEGITYTSINQICKKCDTKRYNSYMRRVEEGLAIMEE